MVTAGKLLLLFLLLIVTALATAYRAIDSLPEPESKIFCAYNRVFVEFKNGTSVWGTLMLDHDGLPVPCSNDDEKEVPTVSKTRITT